MPSLPPAPSSRVVVVGASLAGLRAAEALRKTGFTGDIVLVGDEDYLPYNRPPLSKRFSDGCMAPEALALHRTAHDVTWRLGSPVVAADFDARTVTLASGEVIGWHGLVIGTGLRPRTLPVSGPETGRHRLRTFDDAVEAGRAIRGARGLVVVGSGFIGCEMAATAATMGVATHVVAPEAAPLLGAVGETTGLEVKRRLERLGVTFHLETVPVRYLGEHTVTGVELSDGSELAADVVVEAVGSTPNVEWLAGNGLDLTNGVLTDSRLHVANRPDVVACGDVARFPILGYDQTPRRLEHWTVAVDTARQAGTNLAHELLGQPEEQHDFSNVPSFWSHMGDVKLQSFGQPALGLGDVRVLEGDLGSDVAIGYHRADELVGVVLFGMTSRYSDYRRAVDRASSALVSA
jgi:3-phenylpropionate/trans-cinnamate dioxygenase ferredoxin reductase subunit